MRLPLAGWVLFASFLGGPGAGCTLDRDSSTDVPGTDMAGSHPPLCAVDDTRCSVDGNRVEVCDGKHWNPKQSCDIAGGQSCRAGRCVSPCDNLPSGSTGCSFYPANLWSTSIDGQLGIVASNTSSTLSAQVTLEDASGAISSQTAPPGGLVVFRLDHGRNKLSRTEQQKKAFHLYSTAPVAAYLFHPIDAAQVRTGSATVLLPEHVMAKDYYVMSYTYNASISTQVPQGQGLLAVVGLADNTDVQVTVPVLTEAGGGIPAINPHGMIHRTVNRFEVLEIIQSKSMEDISGAVIKANKNVVVYGGAGLITVPSTAVGGDHVGAQMFPLTTWGKHYVATKFKQRNGTDKDFYRVVASVDMTHVTFTGLGLPPPKTLAAAGDFYEFSTDQDFEITADQPIMALQYLAAWGNLSGNFSRADFPDGPPAGCMFSGDSAQCLGDANMAPLVPVEQYLGDYIFYVPQTYDYNFINVVAPLGSSLTLDGKAISDPLKPFGTGNLGKVIVRVQAGNHRIAGDNPLGLMSYGYGFAVSYCYPGGMNLQTINPIPGIVATP